MSAETEAADRIYAWPKTKVYVRSDLRTGEWTEEPRLDCVSLVERLSPAVGEATFVYRAGTVLHPDASDYATLPPLDVLDDYVRIDFLPPEDDDDGEDGDDGGDPPPPDKTVILRFADDQRVVGGNVADGIAQPIVQTLRAVGLEDELDHITITGGFLADPGATDDKAASVMTAVVFNEQSRIGLNKIGNRCADRVGVPDLDPGVAARDAYAFDAAPRADGSASELWSIANIVEYLFLFFVTAFDVDVSIVVYGPGDIDPMTDALGRTKPARVSLDGMTVKQALDGLLRPERGLGWCVRPAADTADLTGPVALELHVFSRDDTDVVLSEATIPANADVATIDAVSDPQLVSCRLSESASDVYGEVLVLGEPVLSCFTLAFTDGTLEKDWTDAEQAKYLVLADPAYATGTVDAEHDLDALRHVYCRYRPPASWDGRAGNGTGGAKTLVNPKLDSDTGALTTTVAPLLRVRRGFEDVLPVQDALQPADADSVASGERVYRHAMVLVKYYDNDATPPVSKYGYADFVPASASRSRERADVHMPADRLAVQLSFATPHTMANTVGATESNDELIDGAPPAVYAYQDVIATVALRTDQRLFARRTSSDPDAGSRRLVLEVNDAELWLIAPQTVTGIDASGQLIHFGGDRLVRDDTSKLDDVAIAAAAWFGTRRRGLDVAFGGARLDASIGQFIGSVVVTGDDPVNLCLSEIEYDFVGRTTRLRATRGDLDFAGLFAPPDGPTAYRPPTAPSVGLTQTSLLQN